jgi:uncharacterized membrane protein
MTLELWLHLAHVASAIVWVGGGVMLSLVGVRVRRSEDRAVLAEFAETLSYLGLRLFTPAVVVVLLSGIGLVLVSSEWDFTQLWVLLALGAFVIAFLIGVIFLSRSALEFDRAVKGTADLAVVRQALGRWIAGYAVVLIILAFVLWDMIFKPGA